MSDYAFKQEYQIMQQSFMLLILHKIINRISFTEY